MHTLQIMPGPIHLTKTPVFFKSAHNSRKAVAVYPTKYETLNYGFEIYENGFTYTILWTNSYGGPGKDAGHMAYSDVYHDFRIKDILNTRDAKSFDALMINLPFMQNGPNHRDWKKISQEEFLQIFSAQLETLANLVPNSNAYVPVTIEALNQDELEFRAEGFLDKTSSVGESQSQLERMMHHLENTKHDKLS